MLERIRQLLGGKFAQRQAVDRSRLIPDPNRVEAGFSFWLGGLNEPIGEYEVAQGIQTEFLDGLRERGLDENEAGIPLDSPFLPEIVAQLKRWKRARHFRAGCRFEFKLRQEAQPEWEWYQLSYMHDLDIDWLKWECKADRIPSSKNWDSNGFMSERLRRAIEAEQLTGLDFVWVPDVGRRKAPQWYFALAKHPLGRGLDHPLFDPVRGVGVWHERKLLDPKLRSGIYNFRKEHFWQDLVFGDTNLDALLEVFPDREVNVCSFPQLLRGFVPNTDFAYMFDVALPTKLCCNRRARSVMIKGGFLSEKDFDPLWIWDTPPPGAEILDDPNRPCRPAYPLSEDKWHKVLERVAQLEPKAKADPKPAQNPSAADVFARLSARSEGACSSNPTTPSDAELVALKKRLPGLPRIWETVLRSANGIYFSLEGQIGSGNESYDAATIADLPGFHQDYESTTLELIPDAPQHLLHFASELAGDWLAFDLDSMTPDGDCKVIKFDHETSSISREWPSILQLLDEALTIAESEPEEE